MYIDQQIIKELKTTKMFKISEQVVIFIMKAMENWTVELMLMFGLFNGISIFLGYLTPKPLLQKDSSSTI